MDPLKELAAAEDRKDWNAAATICERSLADFEKAIAHWRRTLETDEHDAAALDGLERMYKATARWTELAELLEHRLAGNPGKDQAATLLSALLSIYRDELADDHRAEATAKRLVELGNGNVE